MHHDRPVSFAEQVEVLGISKRLDESSSTPVLPHRSCMAGLNLQCIV